MWRSTTSRSNSELHIEAWVRDVRRSAPQFAFKARRRPQKALKPLSNAEMRMELHSTVATAIDQARIDISSYVQLPVDAVGSWQEMLGTAYRRKEIRNGLTY